MKDKSVENFIKNAQVGHLSKDEYRDFQKKLKSDGFLAEKCNQLLLQEELNCEHHPGALGETDTPTDLDPSP